jgi:rSAM/selenodomain-associated transferase 1
MSARILVFARLPVPGHVKTRLAAGIGDARACCFYAACAGHALTQAAAAADALGAEACLCFSDAEDGAAVAQWLAALGLLRVTTAPQAAGGLGDRLHAAFAESLALTGGGRVLVVGSDVPSIDSAVLCAALEALLTHDLVLGPAHDGGYYLIGLCGTAVPAIFRDVPWSTERVLSATLAAAQRLQLRVAPSHTLPVLGDVDTVADLRAWLDSPGAAVHTLAASARAALCDDDIP